MKNGIKSITNRFTDALNSTYAEGRIKQAKTTEAMLSRVFDELRPSDSECLTLYRSLIKKIGKYSLEVNFEDEQGQGQLQKQVNISMESIREQCIKGLLNEEKTDLRSELKDAIGRETYRNLVQEYGREKIVNYFLQAALVSYAQAVATGNQVDLKIPIDANGNLTKELSEEQLEKIQRFNSNIATKIDQYTQTASVKLQTLASKEQIQDWKNEAKAEFDRILSNEEAIIEACMIRESFRDQENKLIKDEEAIKKALQIIDDPKQITYQYDKDRTDHQFKQWNNKFSTSEKIKYEAASFTASAKTCNLDPDTECFKFYVIQMLELSNSDNQDERDKAQQLSEEGKSISNMIRSSLLTNAVEEKLYHQSLQKLENTDNLSAIMIRDSIKQMVDAQDPLFSLTECTQILNAAHNTLENPSTLDPILSQAAEKIEQLPEKKQSHQNLQHALIGLALLCLVVASILFPPLALFMITKAASKEPKPTEEAISAQTHLKHSLKDLVEASKSEKSADKTNEEGHTDTEDTPPPSPRTN